MVEVFKTNVTQHGHAIILLDLIHRKFNAYQANFDLDDCDHILRVMCSSGDVDVTALLTLLAEHSVDAEVLQDEIIFPFAVAKSIIIKKPATIK